MSTRTLQELVYYPAHDPRKASHEYRQVHQHLIAELDTPCWICGIRNSHVRQWPVAQQRLFQLETHHDEIEWAAAKGVDLTRVMRDWPAIHDADDLQDWIDSENNMLVLCAVHHRGHFTGIHSITYPIWKLQRLQTATRHLFIPQPTWPDPQPAIPGAPDADRS